MCVCSSYVSKHCVVHQVLRDLKTGRDPHRVDAAGASKAREDFTKFLSVHRDDDAIVAVLADAGSEEDVADVQETARLPKYESQLLVVKSWDHALSLATRSCLASFKPERPMRRLQPDETRYEIPAKELPAEFVHEHQVKRFVVEDAGARAQAGSGARSQQPFAHEARPRSHRVVRIVLVDDDFRCDGEHAIRFPSQGRQ